MCSNCALHCTVHCSVIGPFLHCTALHCTLLHCTALHSALNCTALHYSALHCNLHCAALHSTPLHSTARHSTVPHFIALHFTALYQSNCGSLPSSLLLLAHSNTWQISFRIICIKSHNVQTLCIPVHYFSGQQLFKGPEATLTNVSLFSFDCKHLKANGCQVFATLAKDLQVNS